MTEKEKLKEIIETALGFHDYYKVVVTGKDIDRLADKLIEKGYGNVAEWKTRIAQLTAMKEYVDIERRYSVIRENESQKHIKLIEQERDKYKHRAEIAETELEKHKKALMDMCKEYENDVHCPYRDDSCKDECYLCAYNNRLKIAEREIAEEEKK